MAEADDEGRITRAYGFNPATQDAEEELWSTDPVWQADLNGKSSLNEASYHYITTDHLGTPILATDKQGRQTWRSYAEAFGHTGVEAVSSAQINLRFPGQYWDKETGLHQNFFREYSPARGRYVQTDPIGVMGGHNLYSYVAANPQARKDPRGEYGVAGFLGGAVFNFGAQIFVAMSEGASFWMALGCVNMVDVVVSGAMGAIGPSFISQIILRKPGKFALKSGLGWGYEYFSYFGRAMPAGFAIKKSMPDIRLGGDNCECSKYKLSDVIGELLQ